MHQISNIQLIC